MKSSMVDKQSLKTEKMCDRPHCIVFYKSDCCFFCDAANEILSDTLNSFGMSESSIMEIDVDQDEGRVHNSEILGLPTISICQEKILGLPDEGSIRDSLMKAFHRDCFCE